jgi:integrase
MKKRQSNHGLRKICGHSRRAWATCAHPWHFSFKWKDKHYRFSLDKQLSRTIDSKTEAETEAERLRIAIREGRFDQPVPVVDNLTVQQLIDLYDRRYLQVKRAKSKGRLKHQIRKIAATLLMLPAGNVTKAFGAWFMADVTTDTIRLYEETRLSAGLAATNRDLSLLRAMCSWAVASGYLATTPFKRGTETVVRLTKERQRSRRLHPEEAQALLAACGPHLRSVVEAAIETGCRRGELLSLQWHQVEGMQVNDDKTITWAPKAELFLPFDKTKTARDRRIPISTRLKSVLEMRRFDPAGNPLPANTYVFGTAIGSRLLGVTRSWRTAVLRSHGHTPTYKGTGLTPESCAALAEINLHFHDLRREAGSRWMDGGVPIAAIQRWLGHANVSQTSTYLAGNSSSEHDAMARFELQQTALQRLATGAETRGRKRAQTTAKGDRKLNKTAVRLNTPIM